MKKIAVIAMLLGFLSAPAVQAISIGPPPPTPPPTKAVIGAGAIVAVVGIYFLAKHHGKKQDEKQAEFLSKPAPRK